MSIKPLIAAAAIALVGVSAFAAEPTSGLTRADVQAELVRARAAGETSYFSESYGYTLQTPAQAQYAANQAQAQQTAARTRAADQTAQAAGTKASATKAE